MLRDHKRKTNFDFRHYHFFYSGVMHLFYISGGAIVIVIVVIFVTTYAMSAYHH